MSGNTRQPSLSSLLQKNIPGNIRRRGEDYYRGGVVRDLEGGPSFVRANVQGTRLYDVAIDYDPELQVLEGSCTCPFFAENGACKHLWAVLLASEREGLLSAAAKDRCTLLVDVEPEDDPNPLDDDEDETPGWIDPSFRRKEPALQQSQRASSHLLSWKQHFNSLQEQLRFRQARPSSARVPCPPNRQVLYIFDAAEAPRDSILPVEIGAQDQKKDGQWGKVRSLSIRRAEIDRLPDPQDRRLMTALAGADEDSYSWSYAGNFYRDSFLQRVLPPRFLLSPQLSLELVPLMGATGRCRVRRRAKENSELFPVAWDDGPAWDFGIDVVPDGQHYMLTGALRRGEQFIPLSAPLLTTSVLMFTTETAARLECHEAFDWLLYLRRQGCIRVPRREGGAMLERLLTLPVQAPLRLPSELQVEQVRITPKPRLKVHKPRQIFYRATHSAQWEFDYDGVTVQAADPRPGLYQAEKRRLLVRDRQSEERAGARLRELGFRDSVYDYRPERDLLELAPKHLPRVVMQLLGEGWQVEAEGKLYRKPGQIDIKVSSGVDWFELHAEVAFEGQAVPLPRLLQAMRRGDGMVPLGDGTFGLLPEEWLKKYAPLVSLSEAHDDHLRFRPTQVGFLDLLLAAMPEARCDEVFTRAAGRMRQFESVKPADSPPQFTGQLRPYQRYGLGWFQFLSDFRFGGCLADDMGLGKTVQVLARLEERRQERVNAGNGNSPRPSLVVVPRSLIFNWKQEAARFTPGLRVLDHTGAERIGRNGGESLDHFSDYDLVLTTYGTLRRDAAKLKDVRFDYAILDEAQVVKNATTASAKAARLLQAQHRLVLTGTPVENHLGDLWSIFEFLNPGMLGSASVFKLIGPGAKQVNAETRDLLGRALRPFILRRTKEQVEPDLPKKLEQTLYCDLEMPQRTLYDELRDFYRRTLLAKVSQQGLNRSKIQVLEALLRLRQAACHPGLIDPARRQDSSAKLDALLPQLEEVTEAGHKALVFSQFTSLLSILRERLDSKGMPYEYLDGQTRDRAARVQRFQSEPDCPLFLISLKAGGLGLNLTAAEYVFLLDPWWNPAVEAQAIDRAHRIGQERRVFAYRLIARDTVEEKVLELQSTKRDLADAILNVDNSLIRNLGREDLELLLS